MNRMLCSLRRLVLLIAFVIAVVSPALNAGVIDPVNPPENLEVQVPGRTAAESWTLRLYQRTCRTKDFKLLMWTKQSGYAPAPAIPPVRTYRGTVKELPNALVVAGLAPDGELFFLITEDGRTSLFFDGYYVNHTTRPVAGLTYRDPPPVPVVSDGDLRPGSLGTSSLGIGMTRGQAPNGVRYDHLVEAEYAMEIPSGVWTEHRDRPHPIDSALLFYEFIMVQHDLVMTRDAGVRVVLPLAVIRQDPLEAPLPFLGIVANEWRRKGSPLASERWDVVWHVRGDDHPRGYSMVDWPKNSFACGPQLDHEAGHLWSGQHDPYGDSAMQYGHIYFDGMDWQIMEARRRQSIDHGDLPPASERFTDPIHPRTCTDAVRLKPDQTTDIDVLANDWSSNGSHLHIVSCQAKHGTASVTAAGLVHYVPPPGLIGKDVIVYTVQDDSPLHLVVSELVHVDLLNAGLVAHYQFTDRSGTAVTDTTGHGLHGVLSHSDSAHDGVAAPTGRGMRIWGKSNEARHFYNGLICADQGCLLPHALGTVPFDDSGNRHSNALDVQDGDFSLALWFRCDSFALGPCLAKKSADTDDLFAMRLGWFLRAEPDQLRLWCTSWGPQEQSEAQRQGRNPSVINQAVPITWQTNRWYHVAMAIDRTANETRLYLDGRKLSTTSSAFFAGSKLFHGRVPLRVATNSKGSLCVADVRIYATALIDDEVTALHKAGGEELRILGTDTTITVNAGVPLSPTQGNDSLATFISEGVHGPITYTKLDGPTWLMVSAQGRLTGQPPSSTANQSMRVRMTDAANRSLEQDFILVTRNGGMVSEFWLNNNVVHPLLVKAPRTQPYHLGFSPDRVEFLSQAEIAGNQGDNHCTNLFAWLVPPTSGDYRFWIAADDEAVLEVSTDEKPYHARVIARSPTVKPRDWNAHPEQASAVIPMIAGQRYFLTARMQQTTGPDHLAVAWSGPGISQQVIPGSALQFYLDPSAGVTLDLWPKPGAAADGFLKSTYPSTPPQTQSLPAFFSKGLGQVYVARYQARLIPEKSGVYTFWIASGDESELRLSTDETPDNRQRIASVPGYSEVNRWDKFASMKSATIELVAGKRYYIEAVMRQNGGDFDNLSVAWLPPDGVRGVIPGRNLEALR